MIRPRTMLKLKGKDAKEFWENEKNPKVTKEQIELFNGVRSPPRSRGGLP